MVYETLLCILIVRKNGMKTDCDCDSRIYCLVHMHPKMLIQTIPSSFPQKGTTTTDVQDSTWCYTFFLTTLL